MKHSERGQSMKTEEALEKLKAILGKGLAKASSLRRPIFMTTETIAYIDCDGVNVPDDWTVEELRWALAQRKTRFPNEEAIIAVFAAKKGESKQQKRRRL
jgi:hypothetical protein